MKISAKTLFCASMVTAALVAGGRAFAQSNISTDSSTTTDTTSAAGMKGQDSVRPADSTMGETTVQKHSKTKYSTKHKDVDGTKSGTTQTYEDDQTTSTTDDSNK